MRILVTDGMDKTAMAQLREHGHEVVEQFYEPDQLGAALRDFDVAVVRSKTKVRKEHIDAAKGGQLKLIIRGGVGVDNIDVDYAKANGIDVKNTPRASSQSVAELAMGHMFACARYLSIAGHTMREGKWEKKAYGKGIELQGKTLGIVGFGRREHRQDEGRRGGHQHLPGQQRGRGRPAGRSGVRQGPRRRSGRVRQRARHQRGAVQPPHGVLHASHRRSHRGGPEAHRPGDRGDHCRYVTGLGGAVPRPLLPAQCFSSRHSRCGRS